MRSRTLRNASGQCLLELAQACINGALQFDYLSSGSGHRQSTAVLAPRVGMSAPDRGRAASSQAPPDAGHSDHDLIRQYLVEIAKRKRLSSSEEYRLARAARDGLPAARRRLIEHHLALVVMLARRYRNRGLPLLDLIEEGNMGLMMAVERFDPERGHRFSTYARWWICQSIDLAVMTQTRVVHVPVHVTRALKRRAKGGVSAAAHDVTKFLLYDASDQADTLLRHPEHEPRAVIDTLAAPEEEQPERPLQLAGLRRRLLQALAFLNDNEQLIVRSRFGLDDDASTPRTLESLAAQLQLSSERVRQIQTNALLKLRRVLESGRDQGRAGLL